MRHYSKTIFSVLPALMISILVSIGFAFNHSSIVRAQEEICTGPFESVSPALTDLGDGYYVRMDGQTTTFRGGLYPDGRNQPPTEHTTAGLAAAARIEPLDANGSPDPSDGKIVMISIGMSNTGSEFRRFIRFVDQDPEVNTKLLLIDGALGGQTAERWIDPQARTWQELDQRLEHARVSNLQVQVAWIKQTLTQGGDFPNKAQELQSDLELIATNLKQRFPNLQIAFFSSRTRSYTYWRGLSPEPLAYETGFSVKWMIEKQINGDPELNFDPLQGEVKVPFLAWGPYLWADGTNPRSDGLVWNPEDLTRDCTHPSESGRDKVANQLLEFFKTTPFAQSWFLEYSNTGQETRPPTPQTPHTTASLPIPTKTSISTATHPPLPSATLVSHSNSIQTSAPTSEARSSDVQTTNIVIDRVKSRGNNNTIGWLFASATGLIIIFTWIYMQIFQSIKKK